MKKILIFFLIFVMSFALPISVCAYNGNMYVEQTEFEYDGFDKILRIVGIPEDVNVEDIQWNIFFSDSSVACSEKEDNNRGDSINIGRDVTRGSYSISIGEDENILSGTFEITAKAISVKPVDVTEEFTGQTITPKNYTIVSGNLVNGHSMMVTYSGSLDKVGEAASGIISCSIADFNKMDVTHNYMITTGTGKLKLLAPFVVDLDPEQEGSLGGGTTAKPPITHNQQQNSGNNVSTGNSGATQISNTGTSENTTVIGNGSSDTTDISDNRTPLSGGLTPGFNSNDFKVYPGLPFNLALFLAVLFIVAIVSAYLVFRNKSRLKRYR